MINAADFGFSPSATPQVNDAAIQSAAASIGSTGGVIKMPAGKFYIGSIDISQRGVELHGDTRYSTIMAPSTKSGDALTLSGWDTAARHLSVVSDTFRDQGANIAVSGHRAEVEDVFITNDILGIRLTGIAAKIRNTYLHTGKGNGVRIEVGGGDTTQIIDGVLIGAQDGPKPFAGIMVRNSSALTISNTSVLTSGFGLLINPGNGQLVSSLIARDCYFDTGRKGVFVSPEAGGNVTRISLRGCWMGGSAEAGVSITSNGSQICEGISIDGCDIIRNSGPGIEIANAKGVQISDNKISANQHGIWMATGNWNFSIKDNHIGQSNGEPANAGWGVVLDSNANVFQITGNNIVGNGAGKILGFTPNPYRIESNNIG